MNLSYKFNLSCELTFLEFSQTFPERERERKVTQQKHPCAFVGTKYITDIRTFFTFN